VTNPKAEPALVLSGGGARGAYQAGALARIAEGLGEDYPFRIITGVSAGGINAASLAGARVRFLQATRDLSAAWLRLTVDKVFNSDFSVLTWSAVRWLWMLGTGGATPGFEVRGVLDTKPLYRYLESAIDIGGIDANIASGRLRALALSATSYSTGGTITFVHATQSISMWERARRHSVRANIGLNHVMASAALPLVFPAIQIGDAFYGDGGIRQSSPLAPSIHLGADRVLTISARYPRTRAEESEPQVVGYPPPAQILGMLMHGVFLDALENDAERVARINRTLELLPPGKRHPEGLRRVRMFVLRPSRDLGKLSASLAHHLPTPLRIIVRGLGAYRTSSSDFLSYLLFERPYISRLIEMGYEDAHNRWDEIARFLDD
jgi:NTE family protein